MGRVVYIDVSAKLEEWAADSVMAMTNGGETVIIVPARVKRQARDWLKVNDTKKRTEAIYIYRLLALLVYMIVMPELEGIDTIIIDRDYPGDEPAAKIKNELIPLLRKERPDFTGRQIQFQQVKGSKADLLAYKVFHQKRRTQRRVRLAEIQAAGQ